MSFADIKETSFPNARKAICRNIRKLYNRHDFLLKSGCLNGDEKDMFRKVSAEMEDYIAADSIRMLSDYMLLRKSKDRFIFVRSGCYYC